MTRSCYACAPRSGLFSGRLLSGDGVLGTGWRRLLTTTTVFCFSGFLIVAAFASGLLAVHKAMSALVAPDILARFALKTCFAARLLTVDETNVTAVTPGGLTRLAFGTTGAGMGRCFHGFLYTGG